MKTIAALILLLCISCLAGCGESEAGPPDIVYGRDVCENCNMIISEEAFASAYRLPDGTERKFDDIGGMLAFGVAEDELDSARSWVHDHDSKEWIDADGAWFVHDETISTPMAFGIVAFAERGRADEFAATTGGRVLTWSESAALAEEGAFSNEMGMPEDEMGTSEPDGQ